VVAGAEGCALRDLEEDDLVDEPELVKIFEMMLDRFFSPEVFDINLRLYGPQSSNYIYSSS